MGRVKAGLIVSTIIAASFHFLSGSSLPVASASDTSPASGHASFLYGTVENPGRWDGCSVIHVTLADTGMQPKNASSLVSKAVTRLRTLTGLPLHYDGISNAQVQTATLEANTRNGVMAGAPIVVGWSKLGISDLFTDANQVGETKTTAVDANNGVEITGAVVALDSTRAVDGAAWSTLLHEMGHAMGLGHNEDKGQIMQPVQGALTGYGSEDVQGLSTVGNSSGCTR
jgi:Matrixin